MNFIADLEQQLRDIVRPLLPPTSQHLFSTAASDLTLNISRCLTVLFKRHLCRVSPVPRRVVLSPELRKNPKYRHHSKRIRKLIGMLSSGNRTVNDPVHDFLSKHAYMLFNPKENPVGPIFLDYMLFHWNMRHFHIDTTPANDDLLFAMLDQKAAYLIDIRSHKGLYDRELLEIAMKLCPHLFNIIDGATGDPHSETDFKGWLKQNRFVYATTIAGRLAFPFVQMTTAGIPGMIVDLSNSLCYLLRDLEGERKKFAAQASTQYPGVLNLDFQIQRFDIDFERKTVELVIEEKGTGWQSPTYSFNLTTRNIPGFA